MSQVTLRRGDVFDVLAQLPDDSFDCIATSPPYWGLRDYGCVGQIGLEPTMRDYLDTMVRVCRELRRVLKPSGTFWLNVGDSYAGGRRGGNPGGSPFVKQRSNQGSTREPSPIPSGLKCKDLMMIPNRLAIALQDDGWWVRSEIIWHKPNVMPESVFDRPTSCHEKLWLLTKSSKYFYDADAICEPTTGGAHARAPGQNSRQFKDRVPQSRRPGVSPKSAPAGRGIKANESFHAATTQLVSTRNARNVWSVANGSFKGAHFATFPLELVTRCILAGCPISSHVLDPFGGSGTTGIAALRTGRSATLIELKADYCTIIEKRLTDEGYRLVSG